MTAEAPSRIIQKGLLFFECLFQRPICLHLFPIEYIRKAGQGKGQMAIGRADQNPFAQKPFSGRGKQTGIQRGLFPDFLDFRAGNIRHGFDHFPVQIGQLAPHFFVYPFLQQGVKHRDDFRKLGAGMPFTNIPQGLKGVGIAFGHFSHASGGLSRYSQIFLVIFLDQSPV